MDDKTKERIHELAKSLKELHLVATMDEALAKAKQIVLSTEEEDKPLRELLHEVKEEVREGIIKVDAAFNSLVRSRSALASSAHENLTESKKQVTAVHKSKEQSKNIKEQLKTDIAIHKLEKGDITEAVKDVQQMNCAVKDTKTIMTAAEIIQKKKKK